MTYSVRDKLLNNSSIEEKNVFNSKVMCLKSFSDIKNNVMFLDGEIYSKLDIIIGLLNMLEIDLDLDDDLGIFYDKQFLNYSKEFYEDLEKYRQDKLKIIINENR